PLRPAGVLQLDLLDRSHQLFALDEALGLCKSVGCRPDTVLVSTWLFVGQLRGDELFETGSRPHHKGPKQLPLGDHGWPKNGPAMLEDPSECCKQVLALRSHATLDQRVPLSTVLGRLAARSGASDVVDARLNAIPARA